MRVLILVFSTVFLMPAFSFNYTTGGTAIAGEIKYVGSSTVGRYIRDASEVYKSSTFSINTKPESGGGEKVGVDGGADIGGVARTLNPCALKKGAHATLIGKDAIAVIVNTKNRVKSLTIAQLKGIFTGKIKNWKEVGGSDGIIRPLIVKEGSATRKVFKKVVLGSGDYEGTEVVTPDPKIPAKVAKDVNAIGQISFAFIIGKGKRVRPLDIGSQKATVENPCYPITRPLNLVTKGAPAGEAKAFIEWTLSAEGQKVVKRKFVGAK